MSEHDDAPSPLPGSLGASIHDVANALTLVLGWLERAADERGGEPQAIERATSHARWARDELRKLLGAKSLDRDEVSVLAASVTAVVERTLEDLDVEARRAFVDLRARVADTCAESLTVSPQQLWQVLTNLLLNALAAAPPDSRVLVTVEPDRHGNLRYTVEDEGGGISDEIRATLFSRVRTGRIGGAGYGLRSAHALCRAAGGDLVLASTSSQGTRFEVTWPVVEHDTPPARPSRRDPQQRGALAGLEVLVLEDDPSVRELLAFSLSARGARVRLTASLEELDGALGAGPCDVLLTDISPLGGLEAGHVRTTLEALQERLRTDRRIAVVLAITGSAIVEADSAVSWLRKPFTTDELVAAIVDARLGAERREESRAAFSD